LGKGGGKTISRSPKKKKIKKEDLEENLAAENQEEGRKKT
jgi:hypothetical protein